MMHTKSDRLKGQTRIKDTKNHSSKFQLWEVHNQHPDVFIVSQLRENQNNYYYSETSIATYKFFGPYLKDLLDACMSFFGNSSKGSNIISSNFTAPVVEKAIRCSNSCVLNFQCHVDFHCQRKLIRLFQNFLTENCLIRHNQLGRQAPNIFLDSLPLESTLPKSFFSE